MTDSFKRVEVKYIITTEQKEKLLSLVNEKIKENKYFKATICNVYYDTKDYILVRKSLEKPRYKEKIRLRSYGIPLNDSKVFLEIKKKYNGIVAKRRKEMKLFEVASYLNIHKKEEIAYKENENNINNKVAINNIKDEVDFAFQKYAIMPKMYIAYERKAYESLDEKLRITLDENLRYRLNNLALERGDEGKLFLDKDMCVMEIKTLDSIPLWMCHALSKLKIYPNSFSKYGNAYSKAFENGEINILK